MLIRRAKEAIPVLGVGCSLTCPVPAESGGKHVNQRCGSPNRHGQTDMRSKVKHDWIVCMDGLTVGFILVGK